MGRELKRKQEKKEKGKVIKQIKMEDEGNKELYNLVKIFAGVLVFFVVAYLLVGIFVTKEIKWFQKEEKEEAVISKTNILASEIFNMKDETYYVYCYDFDKVNNTVEAIISINLSSENVYRVNITSDFNTKYIGEVSNPNAENKDELSLAGLTLIKIENDKIILYLEGQDNIKNHFTEEE